MPKSQTAKVRARIPEILAGIKEGKTIGEIAREHNVTRRAINFNMVSPEFQALLKQNVGEMLNTHLERINVLWERDDPNQQNEAVREWGRMTRALLPKMSVEQSVSVSTDGRVEGIQRLIASLPYEKRREALKLFEEGKETPMEENLGQG